MNKKLFKPKNAVIKPECAIKYGKYAFSFNPQDQPDIQRFYSVKLTAFESWFESYYDLFRSMKYCIIQCVPEISAGSRIHWHGYIKILDQFNFYLYEVKRLEHHGTIEIDTYNPMEWDLYIKKQKDFVEPWCSKSNVTYWFNL